MGTEKNRVYPKCNCPVCNSNKIFFVYIIEYGHGDSTWLHGRLICGECEFSLGNAGGWGRPERKDADELIEKWDDLLFRGKIPMEKNAKNLAIICRLGLDMRNKQKQYFKRAMPETLEQAKQFEKEFDKMIDEYFNPELDV